MEWSYPHCLYYMIPTPFVPVEWILGVAKDVAKMSQNPQFDLDCMRVRLFKVNERMIIKIYFPTHEEATQQSIPL